LEKPDILHFFPQKRLIFDFFPSTKRTPLVFKDFFRQISATKKKIYFQRSIFWNFYRNFSPQKTPFSPPSSLPPNFLRVSSANFPYS